jgi:hypothetical protein
MSDNFLCKKYFVLNGIEDNTFEENYLILPFAHKRTYICRYVPTYVGMYLPSRSPHYSQTNIIFLSNMYIWTIVGQFPYIAYLS